MKKYIVTLFAAALVLGSSHVARADITSGLAGYWNFDEGSGTSAADTSGSGHTGTLNGTAGWSTGKIGAGAASFPGSSGMSFSAITTGTTFTYAAWVYPTATGGYNNIFAQDNAVGIWLQNGRLSFYYGGDHATSAALPLNTWTHIAVVDSAGSVTLYVNGTADANTYTGGPSFNADGTGCDSGTGGECFVGKIDDSRFYGRALTASDISELYSYTGFSVPPPPPPPPSQGDITSNLTGHWDFNDGSGTSAFDSSGNGNDLVFGNGLAWSSGKIGSGAGTLNGSNQYAQLPAGAFGSYPTSGSTNSFSLTFSTWFKTTSSGVILSQTAAFAPPSATGGYVPAIYIDTAGKLRASMFWHGNAGYQIVSPSSYNDGTWHQVVDTYGTGVEKLYVDGAQVGSQTQAEAAYSGLYYYFLGAGYTSSWPATSGSTWTYLNGSLDDTRTYSRALSSADVVALYSYTDSGGTFQGGGHSQGIPAGGGTSQLSGWAWSSNTGWISFNSNDSGTGNGGTGQSPYAYNVSVSTTTGSNTASFSGYAWSPSLGWISFQPSDLAGCTNATPASAAVGSDGNLAGQITGFVRVISEIGRNDGWDGCARLGDPTTGSNQLSPTPESNTFTGSDGSSYLKGGVTYSPTTGFFKGFAWASTVLGWLNFQNPLAPVKVVVNPPTSNPDFTVAGTAPGTSISLTTAAPNANTPLTISRSGSDTTTQVITPSINLATVPSGMMALITNPGTCTLNTTTASCTFNIHIDLGSVTTGAYTFTVLGTRTGDNVTHNGVVAMSVNTTPPPTGGQVNLYIGRTVAAIDGATQKPTSLDIKKGNKFALEWSINLPSSEYSCNPPLVNKGSWAAWTGADLSFTGSSGAGNVPVIDTSPAGDPASTYTFSISCTSNLGNPAVTGQATLILESSSESEI